MSPIDEVVVNSDNAVFCECCAIILLFYGIGCLFLGDLLIACVFGSLSFGFKVARSRFRCKAKNGRKALVDMINDK